MTDNLIRIFALARLVVTDGLRRNALLGLILLTLGVEISGLFFFQFVPRDIGRVSVDFILSVGWIAGMLFLFFHAVQVMGWGEDRRVIHTILTAPLSRTEYVLGMFTGLFFLLCALNLLLGALGYGILLLIQSLAEGYFSILSIPHYLLAWLGITGIQAMVLSVIIFFSGMVRGTFTLLLVSLSYYLICTGLPVALSFIQHTEKSYFKKILEIMMLIFPDFSRFDYKSLVITFGNTPSLIQMTVSIAHIILYAAIFLTIGSLIYDRRDLK